MHDNTTDTELTIHQRETGMRIGVRARVPPRVTYALDLDITMKRWSLGAGRNDVAPITEVIHSEAHAWGFEGWQYYVYVLNESMFGR